MIDLTALTTREAVALAARRGIVYVGVKQHRAQLVFWSPAGRHCRIEFANGRRRTFDKADVIGAEEPVT